jgi:hypothetical protein
MDPRQRSRSSDISRHLSECGGKSGCDYGPDKIHGRLANYSALTPRNATIADMMCFSTMLTEIFMSIAISA